MAKRKRLSRVVATREPKQSFLIVCEGAKTEPNYFKGFKLGDVCEVNIQGVGENPSKLIDSAEKFNQKRKQEIEEEYDQVWCVFDRDDWPPNDFNNAIHKAKSKGFKVAYSNEAFELWYVLHFEFLDTGIPRQDYCSKLTNHLNRKYEKNDENIYIELLNKQHTALRHAKTLLNQYEPVHPSKDNPSTTVHLLVEALNQFI